MSKNNYFEDFNLGDKYILPSRTQTSGIFSMFQGVSGDNDPIHYDVEFCKQKGHKDMLAHGIQVLSQTAAGAGSFPSEVRQSLLGMIEISGKFIKPVYKTLYHSELDHYLQIHPETLKKYHLFEFLKEVCTRLQL